MPIVDIDGIGTVEFPDSMSEDAINGAIQTQLSDARKAGLDFAVNKAPGLMTGAADTVTRFGLGSQRAMQEDRAEEQLAKDSIGAVPTNGLDRAAADFDLSQAPGVAEFVAENRAHAPGTMQPASAADWLRLNVGNRLSLGLGGRSRHDLEREQDDKVKPADYKEAAVRSLRRAGEGMLSAENAALVAGSLVAPEVTLPIFAGMGANALPQQVPQLVNPNITGPQRLQAAADVGMSGLMFASPLMHGKVTPAELYGREAANLLRRAKFEPSEASEPAPIVQSGEPRIATPMGGFASIKQALDFARGGEPIRRSLEEMRVPQEAAGATLSMNPDVTGPERPTQFTGQPDLTRPGAEPTYDPSGLRTAPPGYQNPAPIPFEPKPAELTADRIQESMDVLQRNPDFGKVGDVATAAYLVRGEDLLGMGVTDFGAWSKKMTAKFGKGIEPLLKDVFEQSKALRGKAFAQRIPTNGKVSPAIDVEAQTRGQDLLNAPPERKQLPPPGEMPGTTVPSEPPPPTPAGEPGGNTVPSPVEGGNDYTDLAQAAAMEPTKLIDATRDKGGITGGAYDLGEKLTPENRAQALEHAQTAQEAWPAMLKKSQEASARKKAALEAGDQAAVDKADAEAVEALNEGMRMQVKKQFFTESVRMHDAIEAVKKGRPVNGVAKEFFGGEHPSEISRLEKYVPKAEAPALPVEGVNQALAADRNGEVTPPIPEFDFEQSKGETLDDQTARWEDLNGGKSAIVRRKNKDGEWVFDRYLPDGSKMEGVAWDFDQAVTDIENHLGAEGPRPLSPSELEARGKEAKERNANAADFKAGMEAAAKPPEPPKAPARNWELLAENLHDNLDSFSPARNTGRIDYEMQDVASRFTDFAKADKSGKDLTKLVSDFAKIDEATPSQLRKLRSALKSVLEEQAKAAETKPPVAETKPAEVATTPAVAAAKVEAQVDKVAATEGTRPAKDIKSELISRIEQELESAPSEFDAVSAEIKKTGAKVELSNKKFEAQKADVFKSIPTTTIDIPGDGVFTIPKTKEALAEVLAKAKRISTNPNEPIKIKRRGTSREDADWVAEQVAKNKGNGTSPESGKLYINPIGALLKPVLEPLRNLRGLLAQRWANLGARHTVDQLADAADNQARIVGRQAGVLVEQLARTDEQDVAGSAAIVVGFDQTKLPALLASVRGKSPEAEAGIQWAIDNWAQAAQIGRVGKQLFATQLNAEQVAGMNVLSAEHYLPGVADTDLWMGHGRPFVIGKSGGSGTSFKKGKTYASPFDAIAKDAYQPQSLKLSELVEHRIKQGQMMLNRKAMGTELKGIIAPSDGKPVLDELQTVSREKGLPDYQVAPPGYVARDLGGMKVAVHEDFAKLFDAVTGTSSKIAEFEPGGVPVGELALQAEGLVKHGLLVFDTFHASRILQKQMFLTKSLPSYRKGFSLLEYPDAALNSAVAHGEITPDMANWVRANRADANLLMKSGLNVGRIQEAMYSGVVRGLQENIANALRKVGVPEGIAEKVEFNKWVFEKMTRGAMLEGALSELQRAMKADPTLTKAAAAMKVSRDLNTYFGNLGRQGVFKSPTMMDMSRLALLAPQWVESMARSEISGVGQLGKSAVDLATKRRLMVGSLGSGLANGLLAYMVGTQVLNLITRKQFTWQNPEKGHKLDAWIPDITGKSNGFFLSPFSVPAELTHDMVRYFEQSKSPNTVSRLADAGSRIAGNKISPLLRAGKVLFSGRDYNDRKIPNVWDRIKPTAFALAPTPLPLAPILKGNSEPGQLQRQLTASAGLKTEPAGTSLQQISGLARDWMRESTNPKIKDKYERELQNEFGESDYHDLRSTLQKEDYDGAAEALRDLVEKKGKKLLDVSKQMRPTTDGIEVKPVPGLSLADSHKFLRSLPPEQQKVWEAAKQERKAVYERYKKLLREIRTKDRPQLDTAA